MEEHSNYVEKTESVAASAEEVLWKLTEETLFTKLRDAFRRNYKITLKENENESSEFNADGTELNRNQEDEEGIDIEEFLKIVDELLESDGLYDSLIIELFEQIDSEDQRKITWDHFLDYNLKALQLKTTKILQFGEVIYEKPKYSKSIAYAPGKEYNKDCNEQTKKILLLGDNQGEIKLMSFVRAKYGLLRKKFQDKMSIYYYLDLVNHKDYVTITSLGRIHSDAIISLEFLDYNNSVASCSRDLKKSFVITEIENSGISFHISIRRGIRCFAISLKHKIIVTGSDDGFVRLWTYHKKVSTSNEDISSSVASRSGGVPSQKPLEIIRVSKTGIANVVILEQLQVFFTCSRDAELKFYDLKDYKCLEVIKLQFECFETFGRSIEWSPKCIYPGPKRENMEQLWERNCLLITCCNIYAKIDLYYMDGLERNLHGKLLPAQPLQNSVLIPKDWEQFEQPQSQQAEKQLSQKHQKLKEESFDLEDLEVQQEKLNFILHKDLVNDLKLKEKAYIHSKIAFLEERKTKMKWAVEQCAPFLALNLYEINEIDLPLSLPIVDNKKTKSVVDKSRQMLKDASARSIIFSDISSSSKSSTRTRSSRSSTYEFE